MLIDVRKGAGPAICRVAVVFVTMASKSLLSADSLQPPSPAVQVSEESTAKTQDRSWETWLERKILPAGEAQSMMRSFLEEQLRPLLPLPQSRRAWLERREDLRREVLTVLGIEDLAPATWDLALRSKGTLQRDGY